MSYYQPSLLAAGLCLLLAAPAASFSIEPSRRTSTSTTTTYSRLSPVLFSSFHQYHQSADREEEEWEEMIDRLQDFHDQHGHCRVPPSSPLAQWCATQERKRRYDMLSSSRVGRLESLGMFVEDEWDSKYRELQQFQQEQGHCSVPKTYPPNQALADWVAQQHRGYRLDMISKERVEKLKEIGAIVDVETRRIGIIHVLEDKWEEKFEELKLFQETHGHCNVPSNYDPQLAEWVQYQKNWKGLEQWEDRKERLMAIGFRW